MKKIAYTVLFIALGFGGGVLALHLFSFGYIERFLVEGRSELAPIQLVETREVIIRENEVIIDAVEKIQRAVIGVKSPGTEGSGVIVSSDGLVVTLADLVPAGATFSFHINGEALPYEVKKRDLVNNLALIKVEGSSLPTLEFSDANGPKNGERIFLVGTIFDDRGNVTKSVNEGIVKRVEGNRIVTNIFEDEKLAGSTLFDIKGRVLGINSVSADGSVTAVSISTIREFAGL